ncbi:hypothetical protein COOONC_13073 [Cooperia oncophora]
MLSSEALCKRLNDNCDLVNVVLNTGCYLLAEKLHKTEMTLDPFFLLCTNPKQLEDNQCDWDVMYLERNATMTQHGYWFVMGDMQNLLAHSSLAINTVLHPTAFSHTYVTLLKRMQAMFQTMTQHGYWFVMGDMQNLLAHSSLAINTVLHPTAFSHTYVTLLKRMQGMNVNWRIIRGEHRENDNTDLVQR